MWNEASAKPCTRILFLQLLLGVLLLGGVFLLAVNEDIAATQRTMVNTVNYVKEQCNRYSRIGLADESKSLMRIVESANQTAHRLEETTRPVSADFLHTCVKDCYVSGILLLDEAGNITAASEAADMAAFVHENLDSEALLNTARYPEKRYAVRLFCPEGCYLDLAAVQRLDAPGIVVAYYHTPLDYINSFSLSISSLLSGYDPAENGTIVVSSGNEIIASNEESFIGGNTDTSAVLEEIRAAAVSDRLVSARENGVRYFGLMEHGRNVYVYAYLPQRAVFRTTPENMLFAMVIYFVILAAIRMVRWKTAQSYREKQLAIQKEYTEQLQLKNEQLYAAVEQADRANAAKTSFLSRMSHDIRTPLNGIIGLLEIDEAHAEDHALIRSNQKKMKVAAKHLLSLINDILQMSKLESGEVILSHEIIDLNQLTRDILTIMEQRAAEAGITLRYEGGFACMEISRVYGSPLHLRQIFLNIYGNCIKYNRPGGKITTHTDSLGEQDGKCTYRWTISDTGIGMSPDFVDHIFEPFTQEKQDARSYYHGTGLGMTITKELVDRMGGSITVTSQLGVGSTFVITLPFEIAPSPEQTPDAHTAPDISIAGCRLLLVEDNALNAEIAQILLTDEGATVTVVTDGKQAVEIVQNNPPDTFDAVLMDVMMPVMNGIDAAKTIRSLNRPDAKTLPIIAMTANAFYEDAQKCLAAGMNAHLAKPLQIKKVKQTIAEWVKNNRTAKKDA